MQDEKILDLFWSRDEAAIEQTQAKYGAYCSSVARNILQSPEDCEECVNDTWLRAWNAIPPQRPKRLRMFLAKITRNLAFDRYKTQSAQKRNAEAEVVLAELEQCLTTGISTEDHVLARELEIAMGRFVKDLPAREANVFVRRYFFADPIGDIAKRYSLTTGNVTVILARTRQKLRAYLKKEGYLA